MIEEPIASHRPPKYDRYLMIPLPLHASLCQHLPSRLETLRADYCEAKISLFKQNIKFELLLYIKPPYRSLSAKDMTMGAMLALGSYFYVPLVGDGATNSRIGSGQWTRFLLFLHTTAVLLGSLQLPLLPPLFLKASFSCFGILCICISCFAFSPLSLHVFSSRVVSCPFLFVLSTYVSR
ncbi:hypothetical protein BJX64DRAFT_90686 [Aspergillus heterothallicus]